MGGYPYWKTPKTVENTVKQLKHAHSRKTRHNRLLNKSNSSVCLAKLTNLTTFQSNLPLFRGESRPLFSQKGVKNSQKGAKNVY